MNHESIEMHRLFGDFADDKDGARELRTKCILPALRNSTGLCLNFHAVENTTQSFIHACISEALRLGGREALQRMEFKACNEIVQAVIATVVEYSIRAYNLAREPTPQIVMPVDVPQADNLEFVRKVIDAVAMGDTTPEDIVLTTNFSLRHVHYRMHAGRILGYVRVLGRNLVAPTPDARILRSTRHGSADEVAMLETAIKSSPILRLIAPELLARKAPARTEIAARIEKRVPHLSRATAMRRAQCLLAWRRQIQEAQLNLPNVSPS